MAEHVTRCRILGAAAILAAFSTGGCSTAGTPPAVGPGPVGRGAPVLRWEYRSAHQTYTVQHDTRGRPYLYVAARTGGLLVLDVSNPAGPRLVRTVPGSAFNGRYANNLFQVGDRLYVAIGNFTAFPFQPPGLAVVDVSDPAAAAVIGMWEHGSGNRGAHVVEVRGPYAYLGASFEGLIILDVSDPGAIRFVSRFVPDIDFPTANPGAFQRPAARGLAVVSDDLLLLAYDAGGLRVLDIRDKSHPAEVGRYINRAIDPRVQAQAYNNVVVDGRVAYVAVDYCGVEVLDVSDATNVRQLGWWNPWQCVGNAGKWLSSPGHTNELVLQPEQDRLFASAGDTELVVLDTSDPATPAVLATYGGRNDNRVAWGLDVTGTHVFLAHIVSPGGPFRSNWSGVTALSYP